MDGAIRGVFGYCFLVLMVRVAGRRPGKQMTPYEFVFNFFVGGLTSTTMVGEDRSLVNAIAIITSIAVTHFAMALARLRWPGCGKVVDGTPLVLLAKGKWHSQTMERMCLQDQDVMAAARDKALERLDQIDYAILERNGEISIIPGSNE